LQVYIEAVIIDNFLVDYMVLTAVGSLLPCKKRPILRAVAAGVGTLYAVLVPLKGYETLSHPIIKLLMGMVLVGIAFGIKEGFFKRCACFYGFSTALGGMLICLGFLLEDGGAASQGYLQTSFAPWVLAPVCYLSIKGCVWMVRAVKAALMQHQCILKIAVTLGGQEVVLPAMVDTGNLLTVPPSGLPVIVCPPDGVLLKELSGCTDGLTVPVVTALGPGELTAHIPKRVCLMGEGETCVAAAIAVSYEMQPTAAALVPASLL